MAIIFFSNQDRGEDQSEVSFNSSFDANLWLQVLDQFQKSLR